MLKKFINILSKIFYQFTGHHHDCLLSISNFMELMYKPVDAASLGIARMLFGIMMLIDIPEERGGSDIDFRFGEPKNCSFPLFPFIKPLTLPFMGVVYAIMWFGALGITLGYKFRLSCLMFCIPYWYLFLLDKSVWNNHSYLFGLCGLIFLFSQSHRYCSIDALQSSSQSSNCAVPFWNYFIIKYQFFILYTIAGLKKLSSEWLSGYALLNLGYHWVFSPFRFVIGKELTDLLIVHWFGCVFDLTIVFWLIYRKTRPLATIFALSFHFMNSRLFAIGMFPWLCVVELPLFYKRNWPKVLTIYVYDKLKIIHNDNNSDRNENTDENNIENVVNNTPSSGLQNENEEFNMQILSKKKGSQKKKIGIRKQITIYLMLFYCAIQLFLPYSHFITRGYNNWTDGIYGYSWDMMIHAWDTVQITIRIVDNGNGKSHFIEPNTFTENDRWSKHADMAKQHAICINEYLKNEYHLHRNDRNNLLTSDNYSIYFDVWCSLNGRFQQRMFNPNIDILRAEWSPFMRTPWIMPLLKEFTDMRTNISKISNELLSQNNYTDILFIADFPTFILDNFIADELENVTLTVLEGAVRYESDSGHIIDRIQKQSITIESGVIHKIETISETPSCYMYTYVNKTMRLNESEQNNDTVMVIIADDDDDDDDKDHTNLNGNEKLLNKNNKNEKQKIISKLPILSELKIRYENYKRFLANIANSFLFIIYKVPMPVRLK